MNKLLEVINEKIIDLNEALNTDTVNTQFDFGFNIAVKSEIEFLNELISMIKEDE